MLWLRKSRACPCPDWRDTPMTTLHFISVLESSLLAINFLLLYLSPQTLRGAAKAVSVYWACWLTSASDLRGLPKIQTTRMLKK